MKLEDVIRKLLEAPKIGGSIDGEFHLSPDGRSLVARIYLSGGRDEDTDLLTATAQMLDVSDNKIPLQWELRTNDNGPYKLINDIRKRLSLS